jgi:hypothetical protein
LIESVDLPKLAQLYNDMRTGESMMKEIAKKERALHFYGKWSLIIGALLGIAGIAVAIFK